MNLYEYQSEEIFGKFGIPVLQGKVTSSPDEAVLISKEIGFPVVIKAQVLTGGRGKAGGVKLASSPEEAYEKARQILGMEIKGYAVKKVLVVKASKIKQEFYAGVTVDRKLKKPVFLASSEGGMDIEEIARTKPEAIIKYPFSAVSGLKPFEARKVAFKLVRDSSEIALKVAEVIEKLSKCFLSIDASLAEINPLALTNDGVLALDGKIVIDDNALFRQKEIESLREPTEEEMVEIEAKEKGFSYIKLSGSIGCLVNGAGLAMATMDMIKLFGGEPANFLDIGGSSNPEKVLNAILLVTKDPSVKAILINIFGGITRCDDVARGLIEALKRVEIKIPIVIRLSGTNEDKAKEILSGTSLIYADSMLDAVKRAVEISRS